MLQADVSGLLRAVRTLHIYIILDPNEDVVITHMEVSNPIQMGNRMRNSC